MPQSLGRPNRHLPCLTAPTPFLQVASAITPVPGGVGPMTIAALIHNTLVAARHNATARCQ